MRAIYCPYTDREILERAASSEHIIPLSLGGASSFNILVDQSFNSKVGTELDGALANEFLWGLERTKCDARGHSGKAPLVTIRNASYGMDSRQAEVRIHRKHGIAVWDVRDREYKTNPGLIRINTSLNVYLPCRFAAKVALAAGYYVYGNLFRKYVDHSQLRDVMSIDPAQLDLNKGITELGLDHLTILYDDYLQEPPSDSRSKVSVLREFCERIKGSVVVLTPGPDYLMVGVGLMGRYLAMVNVPAKTDLFPNTGRYHWGHVLASIDRKLKQSSWMDCLSWLEAAKSTAN